MTSPDKTDPRYPTGRFTFDPELSPEKRQRSIAAIRETPAALRAAVEGLTAEQIETPYRVVLNEAIELAKEYGGTDGHKFVNGVLDKLAAELRPHEARAK